MCFCRHISSLCIIYHIIIFAVVRPTCHIMLNCMSWLPYHEVKRLRVMGLQDKQLPTRFIMPAILWQTHCRSCFSHFPSSIFQHNHAYRKWEVLLFALHSWSVLFCLFLFKVPHRHSDTKLTCACKLLLYPYLAQ